MYLIGYWMVKLVSSFDIREQGQSSTDISEVIDQDNHPIRDLPDLPLTISSEVEGELIEAWMRLDPSMSIGSCRREEDADSNSRDRSS